jgi:hypothetical protein
LNDWRNFQHGNESHALVIIAVQMTPCVSAPALSGVGLQKKRGFRPAFVKWVREIISPPVQQLLFPSFR